MHALLKLFAIVALVTCSGYAHAQARARQDPAATNRAIENFLRGQTTGLPGTVSYTIGAVDPRTVLASCASPEVFLPPGARLWGATSVGVRCSGAAPWTIYVSVYVRIDGNYFVAARPLAQGQAIVPADLSMQSGDLAQFPAGVITDPQAAAGRTLVAALAAGQPLRLDLLRAPVVIQQGQSVKLQSTGAGFSVSAEGKSLNNAAEGQIAQVRVANGQTVSGVARPGGVVEIRF